jgi:hypothetical protein
VFRINADSGAGESELFVPFWALRYEEFIAVTMGSIAGPANALVQSTILQAKRGSKPGGAAHDVPEASLSVDTPLPFCVHKLWFDLYNLQYATHEVKPSDVQSDTTRAYELDTNKQPRDKGDAMTVHRARYKGTKNEGGDDDKVYKSASADLMRPQTETLEGRLKDPRTAFLFRPGPWSVAPDGSTAKDLDALLSEWLGGKRPLTVFDLSGIPPASRDDLVGVMLRIIYDAMFWGRYKPEGGRDRPVLIVLEEAHSYLGKGKDIGGGESAGRAARVVRQIAKEGRKYGVGLMLVSQRPSELDGTILSQCGTTIAMRLTNEADRSHVRSCSSDSLEGLFAMLPILRTGEALVVGEAVNLPVRAMIDLPPKGRRPDSEDPRVIADKDEKGKRKPRVGWTEPLGAENYRPLVKSWRTQSP